MKGINNLNSLSIENGLGSQARALLLSLTVLVGAANLNGCIFLQEPFPRNNQDDMSDDSTPDLVEGMDMSYDSTPDLVEDMDMSNDSAPDLVEDMDMSDDSTPDLVEDMDMSDDSTPDLVEDMDMVEDMEVCSPESQSIVDEIDSISFTFDMPSGQVINTSRFAGNYQFYCDVAGDILNYQKGANAVYIDSACKIYAEYLNPNLSDSAKSFKVIYKFNIDPITNENVLSIYGEHPRPLLEQRPALTPDETKRLYTYTFDSMDLYKDGTVVDLCTTQRDEVRNAILRISQ